MAVTDSVAFAGQERSNWVRLRTLVLLRWVAIAGQIAAILVATLHYRLEFELGLASMAVAASILANLVSTVAFPGNRRLSERDAALMLAFDILQLGLLLYLTGGLNNPFALFMLAPVTIAATVLPMRSALALTLLALAIITALNTWSLPIRTPGGFVLLLPEVFRLAFWGGLLVGAVFLAVYARQVTTEMHEMREALVATQLALAREQKLTDLGGVVAAAAHELGTPLATIKLVSSEMIDPLSDRPDLQEDAILIRAQADRCRDILRSMGRAGKDDLHMRRAPFESLVREAAEPHRDRGKRIDIVLVPDPAEELRQPVVIRKPEIIHGMRNLIQNAVDFADRAVNVELDWSDVQLSVRIEDDGNGFPPWMLSRIGDPFVHRRPWEDSQSERPGYEGMGLGLFIAKTLLERTGATLTFANGGGEGEGAIVEVVWDAERIRAPDSEPGTGLGDNRPFLP